MPLVNESYEINSDIAKNYIYAYFFVSSVYLISEKMMKFDLGMHDEHIPLSATGGKYHLFSIKWTFDIFFARVAFVSITCQNVSYCDQHPVLHWYENP